jgi:hypothetical protein
LSCDSVLLGVQHVRWNADFRITVSCVKHDPGAVFTTNNL